MRIGSLLYKATYKKSKEKVELITIIALVSAVVCVFLNMTEDIKKSFVMASAEGFNYDAVILDTELESAVNLSEEIKDTIEIKYNFIRTDSKELWESDSSLIFNIQGIKGDYLEIYEEELSEGRLPETDDEIMLDIKYNQLKEHKLGLGDKIELQSDMGLKKSYTVVGFYIPSGHNSVYEIEAKTSLHGMDTLFENNKYSVCVCSFSDSLEEIDDAYGNIYRIAEKYGLSDSIKWNEEKYQLFQDSVNIDNEYGSLFKFLSAFVICISVFLIYNAIEVTTNERININSLFRCVGMSRRKMNVNMMLNCVIVCIEGIILGWILGFVLNHTLGSLLIGLLNRALLGEMSSHISVYDSPFSYLKGGIAIFAVSFFAYIIIIIKNNRKSILEGLRGTEENKVKAKSKSEIATNKNIFTLLGNKNIKRNRAMYLYTFFSLLASIVLMLVVGAFFCNLSLKDLDSIRKALFCDYEIVFDYGQYINENAYNALADKMGKDKIKGASYDSIWEYFLFDSNEYQERLALLDDEKDIQDLQADYLVNIYIADNSIIKSIVEESDIKVKNVEEPIVLSFDSEINHLTIYDSENRQYNINISGYATSNYLMDYQYLTKTRLIMNYSAAKEYLGLENKYNILLITSKETQEDLQGYINNILDEYEIHAYVQATSENVKSQMLQDTFLMAVFGYLLLSIVIMSLINCYCVIKIIIKQRRREYGIVMAIGMSRKDTAKLVSYEIRKLCIYAISIGTIISIPILIYWFSAGEININYIKTVFVICLFDALFYIVISYLVKKVSEKMIKNNVIINMNAEE